jgi:hypothetical protein
MKLAEAFSRIHAADAELDERRVKSEELTIADDALVVNDRRFPLGGGTLAKLCDAVKAPAAYLESLDAPRRSDLLDYHLRRGDLGRAEVSVISRGSELVALGRADLVRLKSYEVVEAALEGTGQAETDLEVADLTIDEETCRVSLVVHRSSREVVPGDIVQAGIQVTHSPVGAFATKLVGYAHRLVCANGMTHRECFDPSAKKIRSTARTRRLPTSHPEAKRLQLEQVRHLSAQALGALEARLQGLSALTIERVDFNQLTESWLRRARLSPGRLVPVLREAWEEGGAESTAYGVLNAFTRAATHNMDLGPRDRLILSRLGGLLAFRHDHICPRCFALASTN